MCVTTYPYVARHPAPSSVTLTKGGDGERWLPAPRALLPGRPHARVGQAQPGAAWSRGGFAGDTPAPAAPPPPPARTEPLPLKCSTLSVMATSGCCRRRGSVRRRLTHPRRAAGTGQDRTGRDGGSRWPQASTALPQTPAHSPPSLRGETPPPLSFPRPSRLANPPVGNGAAWVSRSRGPRVGHHHPPPPTRRGAGLPAAARCRPSRPPSGTCTSLSSTRR